MRGLSFLIISMLCVLIGCYSLTSSSASLSLPFEEDEKTTILFSHSHPVDGESPYLDVLLELQHAYPDKVPYKLITSDDHEEIIRYFNIHTFPTLLVVEGTEVHLRMEGAKDHDDILDELKRMFSL